MPRNDPLQDGFPRHTPDRTELILTVRVLLSGTEPLWFPVRFVYHRNDPFAVLMEFLGHADTSASWVLSRDLLRSGMRNPSGQGNVRIWPPCRCARRDSLRIMLTGHGDLALLEVPAKPLRSWLEKTTYTMVPAGEESRFIDWEGELARLLSET